MTEQGQQLPYSPNEIEAMLALATTGSESTSDPFDTNTDYSQLTAREIATAIRAVRDAQYREQKEHQWKSGVANVPEAVSEVDRRLAAYDMDMLIDQMPSRVGVEKTRDVFNILAGGLSGDRHAAATYIGALTEADHDHGIELWKRLLEDDDHKVAAHAWESLLGSGYESSNGQELEESLARDGLTVHDWADLIDTYVTRLHKIRDEGTYLG